MLTATESTKPDLLALAGTMAERRERAKNGDTDAAALISWLDRGELVAAMMIDGRTVAQAARILGMPDDRAARGLALYEADLDGLLVDLPDGTHLRLRACEIAAGVRDPLTGKMTALGLGLEAETTKLRA